VFGLSVDAGAHAAYAAVHLVLQANANFAVSCQLCVNLLTSTWCACCCCCCFADEGILYVQLLKRNRRGHYSNGTTAADTFWFSLLAAAKGADRLPGPHPPTCYYSSAYDADDLAPQ
jgi:hypothetical protein